MKSNVVLESQDRNLFGVVIRRNTQGGFLSVLDLEDAYELVRYEYGWGERGINTIMQTLKFRERVYYVLKERGLINVGITTFMELIDSEGIARVLKSFGVYKTTGRGENRQVMADPYVPLRLGVISYGDESNDLC